MEAGNLFVIEGACDGMGKSTQNSLLFERLREQGKRYNYVLELNRKIMEYLSSYKIIHINNTTKSIPFTINFSVKGVKSLKIAKMLEDKDIYVSTKTSCCPLDTPSKLVYALTRDKSLASSSVRVSLSHLTTKEEIEQFLKAIAECIRGVEQNGEI